MNPCVASVSNPARMTPSTTVCGLRSKISRSLKVPGSLSSPLTTMNARSFKLAAAQARGRRRARPATLVLAGMPAPPRPRRSASSNSLRDGAGPAAEFGGLGPIGARLPGADGRDDLLGGQRQGVQLVQRARAELLQAVVVPGFLGAEQFHRRRDRRVAGFDDFADGEIIGRRAVVRVEPGDAGGVGVRRDRGPRAAGYPGGRPRRRVSGPRWSGRGSRIRRAGR